MNCALAVDTASSLMSVCLKKNNAYFEMTIDNGLKHSETLMNTILLVLKEADVNRKDLELLVCSEGPGSFTGLRIGMSTIKGLAFGLSIPYTAVVTTDYLAYGFDYFDGVVVPLMDARKKRYYCGFYSEGKKLEGPFDLSEDEILKKTSAFDKVLFTGPDCRMVSTESRKGLCYDGNNKSGKSRQLLELGLKRYDAEGCLSKDYGPLYLRRSEAEIALYGEKT
ncbi:MULTISPECIES: tRNA (adenosine(37)-N6)-threonylcarbamoyltransferase complex dimerization subunit type 1 TsaB [unclassified Oceanispirochaeta]|uniref:tRNA (adenosine(37)-N6)-threonylcarbamoyltransferase complex dimerization subunit type 1 TsaB n=1 Tax=unclassified Oceanispirochaeta TaxID=2635722 RepID=UPI000E0927F5|nr:MULTISPECIES: tRNA (adenosine(37)-N6)-threonylcarbamoyltransferase complex dimerization subunit type 1 TsaB [unclassified Oceanispirochaeta]MBF9014824.1 tRNA (adenosine(37)-N6)-threonylcarbamoyltransferase complex dimerization subunit type 1 TsaB [Oceanispirochaeta sp. M2]NPD71080.1 tRNA (adenosine(37)-N6)-threonylcarbamoyltransferase complex dimerization subunit type 1 TsaB [Oceanispirochaeta sp. M1]RDG33912.1 tRNA (adenosine(37)-N6)-threonylcarbamoyltransferase complex dimerization subunit 